MASIKTHGVIHPLVVCPAAGDGYRLIDGERRYRACAEAAVGEVPVIVRTVDEDAEALDVALVANMERVELTVLEQSKAFQRLLDSGLTSSPPELGPWGGFDLVLSARLNRYFVRSYQP